MCSLDIAGNGTGGEQNLLSLLARNAVHFQSVHLLEGEHCVGGGGVVGAGNVAVVVLQLVQRVLQLLYLAAGVALLQLGVAAAGGSAAVEQVVGPAMPVTRRPMAFWKSFTACSVPLP